MYANKLTFQSYIMIYVNYVYYLPTEPNIENIYMYAEKKKKYATEFQLETEKSKTFPCTLLMRYIIINI